MGRIRASSVPPRSPQTGRRDASLADGAFDEVIFRPYTAARSAAVDR